MATIAVGVRLEEGLVKRIDEIAEETGTTRTEIIERCIKFGMVREEEFVKMGPVAMQVAKLMLSEPIVSVISAIAGKGPNEKQVKRFRTLQERRRERKKRHSAGAESPGVVES
jgi:hypothetical protein